MHKYIFVRIGLLDNSRRINMMKSTSFGASLNSQLKSQVITPPFGTEYIDVPVKAIHFTGTTRIERV